MARGLGKIGVEGYAQLQRNIRLATDGKLPVVMGQVHKEIGEYVISKVPAGDPHAVGMGRGATLRASARKRDVNVMAGTAARANKAAERHVPVDHIQWGREEVQPFPPRGHNRPYILGAVERNQQTIEYMFARGVLRVLESVFYSVKYQR